MSDRPYSAEERPDENPQTRAFIVTALRDIPARPRIIAGEIAHHLRASVDLLAYQLLLKAGVDDDDRLAACAFPVLTKWDLSTPTEKRKHDDSINGKIRGVDQRAYDRIVALQPCATNGEWSHLAQIQKLDNTDKHRLLLAAASSTHVGGWVFRDEKGNITNMPHHSFVPLQVGTMIKIAPAPPGFIPPNLASVVAFMEPSPVFGYPVDHILRNLSKMTKETVLSFADCF